MTEEEFLALCKKKGYAEKTLEQFTKAITFSKHILADKKRLAGDSFFDHNLRVGTILVENRADPEIVLAGLLHTTIKYVSPQEVQNLFGETILRLIQQEEEIKRIKSKNVEMQAEGLRKILLTTLKDFRVILIKLAAKVDNLKTIKVLPPEEQKRIAEEVLEIYAPLAYRLGMEKIRVELEDLAFRVLHPQMYQEINDFLEESKEQREKDIEDTIVQIKQLAGEKVDILKIKGRPKHIYSIYKKMTQRGVKLQEQYDLLGIRVIVPTTKECYILLGLLHETFLPIEGRLKDYIANPKPNFYRSIHTALRLPNGKIAEVQIRTPEMDEFSEEGIAAHWRYKGVKSDQFFEKKIAWLRGILDLQKEDNKEFVEAAKIDIFGDNINCYTPKGDVKELPREATVLDFAFLIHEEVGCHAVGARVNGTFVPLKHTLAMGDVVEILTNKNQRPRRNWLKIVKSSGTKHKIRKSLREHEKLPAFHFHTFKPLIKEEQGILVESPEFPKAACVLAKCCLALPGTDITGLVTKRRLISVHRVECRVAHKEEERWVPVRWKETFNQKIRFYVDADERSGLLADLLHTIAVAGFEVKEAKAKLMSSDKAQCSFLVVPRDLEQLKGLVVKVGKVKGVKKIFFE